MSRLPISSIGWSIMRWELATAESSSERRRFRFFRFLPDGWVAGVLLVVFPFAIFSSFIDSVLFEHRVCGDHGELIHQSRTASAESSSTDDDRYRRPMVKTELDHHHCSLGTANHHRKFVDRTPDWVVCPGVDLFRTTPVFAAVDAGQLPIYRTAPKQSPPT